jgi:hypothetical protein
MEMAIDVLVIGTDPPCPRCDLVSRLVGEAAVSQAHLKLRHCSFDSLEATTLGRRLGCKIGTAKHVALEAGITKDWDAVYETISRKKASARPDCRPADTWTPELDALLEPCRAAAASVGYLMTPVLVVNGKVKHHGSVPPLRQIAEWVLG